MDLNKYYEFTDTVWREPATHVTPLKHDLAICALGLAGEAGEVIEKIKKLIHYNRDVDLDDMEKELGDVIFYWVRLVKLCGLDPNAVIEANVDKLMDRQDRNALWGAGSNR